MSVERIGKKTQDAITGLLLLFAAFPVVLLFEGWVGATLGFVMMFWGLMLASKPLAPLLVNIPYAGELLQKGVFRFAIAMASAITIVFLLLEWLWYHILVLCLIALLALLLVWLLRNKLPWGLLKKRDKPTTASLEDSGRTEQSQTTATE